MESFKSIPQSLISSFSSTSMAEPENSRSNPIQRSSKNPNSTSKLTHKPQQVIDNPTGFMGTLEIFIHYARDIQNICIYHKQDVYAKLYLTNDPESSISTKIINGGGRNPVFNESARLNVQTIDSSLKCEIWMLSRAKNYLGDQLLGFALVPLIEVIMGNGELTQEFSLSATDLAHSPSGFVQLTVSYTGSSPEVMIVTTAIASAIEDGGSKVLVIDESVPCEYDKIEFPDLNVVNENKMMVSEYYGIPCTNVDSQNGDDCPDNDVGVKIVESFATEKEYDTAEFRKDESPISCVSTDTPSMMAPTNSEAVVKPLIEVNIKLEQPVVRQEIVDMYMKSMQQFTESLANMKLPMDIENGSGIENGNGVSGKKLEVSRNGGGRVFYGSRAFF